MKGFLISEHFNAYNDFIKKYRGSAETKRKIVAKFQGKYCWDPVKMIKKHILDQALRMRSEGRSDKDIIRAFEKDPYANIQKTMLMLKQAQQARKNKNDVEQARIYNKLTDGQLYKTSVQVPANDQQYYEMIIKGIEDQIQQTKEKKPVIQKQSRAPLKDGQVYLRTSDKDQELKIVKTYLQGDSTGHYSQKIGRQQMQELMSKLQDAFPEVKQMMNDIAKQSGEPNKKGTVESILQLAKARRQKLNEQTLRQYHEQVKQNIRQLRDQQVLEKQKMEAQMQRDQYKSDKIPKQDRFINQRRSTRNKKR